MSAQKKNNSEWVWVAMRERVDAFNQSQVIDEISVALGEHQSHLALDLSAAKFLSLSSIRYINRLALTLAQKGGKVALVAPSEKIKRQFDIFVSLKAFDLYNSTSEVQSQSFN